MVVATARPSSIGSFGRISKWWASKIAPLLAVAYLALIVVPRAPGDAALRLAALLVSACALATSAYVVNDVFDREEDRATGRTSAVTGMATGRVVAIVAALVLVGWAPWFFVAVPAAAWIALGAITLLPLVYSAPPLRWKERGGLGLVADAALAHVAPTVFALAAFDALAAPGVPSTVLAAAVVSWSVWTGLRAIVGHEVTDLERDRSAGLSTWVVRVGEARARAVAARVLLPAEVASLVVAGFALARIDRFAAGLFVVVAAAFALGRLTGAFRAPLRAVPAGGDPRAALWMFYRFWPAALLSLALAVGEPDLAWVPVVHVALFAPVAWGEARSLGVAVLGAVQGAWGFLRHRAWWWFHDHVWHPVDSWFRYRAPEHAKRLRSRTRAVAARALRPLGVRRRSRPRAEVPHSGSGRGRPPAAADTSDALDRP